MGIELKLFDGFYDNKLSEPDILQEDELSIDNIPPSFAISRNDRGEILSSYYDDTWDLSPYTSYNSKHKKLYFSKIDNKLLEDEAKKLTLLMIIFGSGNNSSLYSVSTLSGHNRNIIVPLSMFAKEKKTTLKSLLECTDLLIEYAHNKCTIHAKIKGLSVLLHLLSRLDNNITNIQFEEDRKLFNIIQKIYSSFRSNYKQTPIIPSRILQNSLIERWNHINTIEPYLDKIASFLKEFLTDINFAIGNKRRVKTKGVNVIFWNEAIRSHQLEKLFVYYNVVDRHAFKKFMNSLQGSCKNIIHAYSGMRDAEVLSLKTNCLEKPTDIHGAFKLVSITTKIEESEKTVKWVTSKDVERVIKILAKINTVISDIYSIKLKDLPLFTAIFLNKNTKLKIQNHNYPVMNTSYELTLPQDTITLTAEDKKEIIELDIFGTMQEIIEIGQPWIFKSHQYRRSIAVYAILSGIVNLGALQLQLKHLFRVMTIYYTNGASFAKKIFDVPSDHFGNEIDKLKPEFDALMYIKNVIFSDEELFGSHGTLVKRNLQTNDIDYHTYLLENRKKTTKKFKNGEISYKETALGGCVSIEACDYALTRSIVACPDCDSGIIKKSKLDNAINEQKEFIELLNKDSIEYRTEVRDLEELEKQRKIFLGSKA